MTLFRRQKLQILFLRLLTLTSAHYTRKVRFEGLHRTYHFLSAHTWLHILLLAILGLVDFKIAY